MDIYSPPFPLLGNETKDSSSSELVPIIIGSVFSGVVILIVSVILAIVTHCCIIPWAKELW